MKLFDNPTSPYAFKVRATLYEKGIDFEKHEILQESQREELLRVSPRGEVPALQNGDFVVYDSRVICEYLEEKYPTPPLAPADPAGRARCRALELFCDTQVDASVLVLAVVRLFRPDLDAANAEYARRASELLDAHCAFLDRELGGDEYLLGPLSLADLALVPHLSAAAFCGYSIDPSRKSLGAWMERMAARPSVDLATQEALRAFEQSQSDPEPFFSSERLHWRNDRIEAALRCGLGPWLLDELDADRAFLSPIS